MKKFAALLMLVAMAACSNPIGLEHEPGSGSHEPGSGSVVASHEPGSGS